MPFDLVAFFESQQAAALAGVAAAADDIYQTYLDDLMVQPVASFLAGILQVGATTPKYCEIRQPSLKTPYAFYKSAIQEQASLTSYDGFTNLSKRPLPLYGEEKLNVYLQNATNEASLVVLALSSGPTSQAALDAVKPTHKLTGYVDQALTAGAWTRGAITWDKDLPQGRYAIVGMKVGAYKAANPMVGAARIVLLNCSWRVGVPYTIMAGDKTLVDHDTLDSGQFPLMPDISFRHDQRPSFLEVISPGVMTDCIIDLTLQTL